MVEDNEVHPKEGHDWNYKYKDWSIGEEYFYVG